MDNPFSSPPFFFFRKMQNVKVVKWLHGQCFNIVHVVFGLENTGCVPKKIKESQAE